jgi:DNA-directed RNA polymerase subunit RPC12/RpoP
MRPASLPNGGTPVIRLTAPAWRVASAAIRRTVVIVRCQKCGASYETSLPAPSVRRVARCPACGRRALEVVDERAHASERVRDEPPTPPTSQ